MSTSWPGSTTIINFTNEDPYPTIYNYLKEEYGDEVDNYTKEEILSSSGELGIFALSVGASDQYGTSRYIDDGSVKDVTLYAMPATLVDESQQGFALYFYCPDTIYAPVDSSYLFSQRESAWYYILFLLEINIDESITESEMNDDFISKIGLESLFMSVQSIDFSNFSTSYVENTRGMFAFMYNMNFTTEHTNKLDVSKVTNFSAMFAACNTAKVDFNNFKMTSAKNISFPFLTNSYSGNDASAIMKILKTNKTTNLVGAFAGCDVSNLDLSDLDLSKVTDIRYMFYNCGNLSNLDISKLNLTNVTNIAYLFAECDITGLDFSQLDTSNVTNMSGLFANATSTATIVSITLNTSNVTDMSSMFTNFKISNKLTCNFDTSKVTTMESMFTGSTMTNLDISSFRTPNLKNIKFMFGWNPDGASVWCKNLTEIDLSNFDLTNVEDAYYALYFAAAGVDACTKIILPSTAHANFKTTLSGTWQIEGDTSGTTYTEITATNGTLGKTLIRVSAT